MGTIKSLIIRLLRISLEMSTENVGRKEIDMTQIDRDIQEIEDILAEMKKKEINLITSIESLHKQAEQASINEELMKLQRFEMQNEDIEVEYKRRLVERFSYKSGDMIKRIYKENREKALKANSELIRFNYNKEEPKLPLYTQPSDLPVYEENIKKFKEFRPKLIRFLQRK